MALTREGIATLKGYINSMKNDANGTNPDEGMGETFDTIFQSEFAEMTESADYAAWVSGTDVGKNFEENLQKLKDVGAQLRSQYSEVVNKLETYVEIQESINAGGED